MTQLECAKNNIITSLVKRIARLEEKPPAFISKGIKDGKIAVLNNKTRKIAKPCAVGRGLKTKINANIGTSTDRSRLEDEIEKLNTAIKYGADAVMDLSVGGDLRKIRQELIRKSTLPIGTVPLYEIAVSAQENNGGFLNFSIGDILETLEFQASQGVDFFTIHAGVTQKTMSDLKKSKRLMGIVSRGGAILANWMARYKKENPFYQYFDKILEIAYEYDITLSLGDGLRPGSIFDATDKAQVSELKLLGKLAADAQKRNVQVIIEGPGHVPINQIKKNVALEKKLCHGAPFYVLGPLVTDVAAGYDHISSAIGAALAASYGADFLCYVTASEHLRHPTIEDVREAVVASKIAAHAADIAKGVPSIIAQDKKMSQARKRRDWKKQIEFSIDPDKARLYRMSSRPSDPDVCTMCGSYCSIKIMDECA